MDATSCSFASASTSWREQVEAAFHAFDIADLDECAVAVEKVIADHGRIDVLVNNAGMPSRKPLVDLTIAEWQQVMDTNLNSCFVLTREAARSMIARRWGRILMISSSGIIVSRPTISAYVSSKAGLAGMARQLAVELGPHNITVNAIAPGLFLTDMARGIQTPRRHRRMFEAEPRSGGAEIPRKWVLSRYS